MVDHVPSAPPPLQQNGAAPHDMKVTQPTETRTSINYRDSLPGAPKPVCARQSFDEPMFHEMYAAEHDAVMPDPTKTTSPPPRRTDSLQKQQQPPALPQKSSLRTSRVLDAVSLKLDDAAQSGRLSQATAPHDVYLSSEEDASSSADDFSDYDFDSESEQSEPPASRKRSYEDIAKVVPLYFGKPTVVNITTVRRSDTPSSLGSGNDSRSATPNLPLRSSSTIPISSTASFNPPPRSTSFSGAFLLNNNNNSQHSFLSTDPYASKLPLTTEDPDASSRASKAQSLHSSSSNMLKKTLGLVRKRSRPNLATNLSNTSMVSLTSGQQCLSPQSIQSPAESPVESRTRARSSTLSLLKTHPPVTYQDIMRNAKRNAAAAAAAEPSTPQSPVPGSPMSPMSIPPEKKSRLLSGLSMAKRMSVRTG